jgi:hypothetical protein
MVVAAVAAVAAVHCWLAVGWLSVVQVHLSLGGQVHRLLGVAVGHSSLEVPAHLSPVAAVGHSSPVAAVGHSSPVAAVGYSSSAVQVGHSSSAVQVDFVVHQASSSVPECPSDHWDWLVAADNRYYYSQPDLP